MHVHDSAFNHSLQHCETHAQLAGDTKIKRSRDHPYNNVTDRPRDWDECKLRENWLRTSSVDDPRTGQFP
jgi:hypothetical protein